MAKGIERLSAAEFLQLADQTGAWNDGGGLWLVVGRKHAPDASSWTFRYMIDGKARALGLGSYPAVSLPVARKLAGKAREAVAMKRQGLGPDPIDEKHAAKVAARLAVASAMTFKQAAEKYIAGHKAGWKNAKHAAQWGSTLATYVYPLIGDLPVQEIDTPHVAAVLEQETDGKTLWTAKPETAVRVRGRIEAILDWAKVRKYRTGDNPARWKGHLAHALPARSKVQKVKHHEAIAIDDLPAFMADLRGQEGTSARALEFAVLTAARTGEVIGATWSEIDLQSKVWTVPAERMKASREHRVPLSPRALEVLRGLPGANGGEGQAMVFPGAKEGRPLSNMALLMLLRRMKRGDLTAHGMRSTFRDWVSERTAFPGDAAEMALAHSIGDKTEAAYRRGDLYQRRVAMMDAWAAFCAGQGTDIEAAA